MIFSCELPELIAPIRKSLPVVNNPQGRSVHDYHNFCARAAKKVEGGWGVEKLLEKEEKLRSRLDWKMRVDICNLCGKIKLGCFDTKFFPISSDELGKITDRPDCKSKTVICPECVYPCSRQFG